VETGDLVVVLQQKEHAVFTRNHDDLFMNHTINITEALCGFKLVVHHLDDRALVLTHPPGDFISPGTIRAIPKEGMPIYKNPFEKGNLYVKFDVKFPENNSLSEEAIKVDWIFSLIEIYIKCDATFKHLLIYYLSY
jgi:DnaJ homolog subfamily A member 2